MENSMVSGNMSIMEVFAMEIGRRVSELAGMRMRMKLFKTSLGAILKIALISCLCMSLRISSLTSPVKYL